MTYNRRKEQATLCIEKDKEMGAGHIRARKWQTQENNKDAVKKRT